MNEFGLIRFVAETDAQTVTWIVDDRYPLGTGPSVSARFSSGSYGVTLVDANTGHDLDRITIRVEPLPPGGTTQSVLVGGTQTTVIVPPGEYTQILAVPPQFDGLSVFSVSGRTFIRPQDTPFSAASLPQSPVADASLRDVRIHLLKSATSTRSSDVSLQLRSSDVATMSIASQETIERVFRMVDINEGPTHPPLEIAAQRHSHGADWELWIDTAVDVDHALLDQLFDRLKHIVVPRSRALWGAWTGASDDTVLHVLVSGRINQWERAIGFFNPNDLFDYINDPSAQNHNPTSNEEKIIYLSMPVLGSRAFSLDSVTATAAHELFHLIHFYRKTYLPHAAGSVSLPREKLFLDEGLAHLAESLVGYGESGGNLAFVDRYLSAPHRYSLSESSTGGNGDSVGRRGAMALFLAWLVDSAGGVRWDGTDAEPHSSAGIAVLRSLVNGPEVGWDNIEKATGRSRSELLRRFSGYVALRPDVPPTPIVDALTGEITDIHPWLGSVGVDTGFPATLSGPTTIPFSTPVELTGATIAFGGVRSIPDLTEFTITSSVPGSNAVLMFFSN